MEEMSLGMDQSRDPPKLELENPSAGIVLGLLCRVAVRLLTCIHYVHYYL